MTVARQFDRIPDVSHAAHRSRRQSSAVHDGGIQLVASVEREHRSMARVEQGIILEADDGARHRVQTRPASLQHRVPGVERRGQTGTVGELHLASHLGARQSACAAMNR